MSQKARFYLWNLTFPAQLHGALVEYKGVLYLAYFTNAPQQFLTSPFEYSSNLSLDTNSTRCALSL